MVIELKPGDFDCPICHSEAYVHVISTGSDGKTRVTSLYQCLGCNVTFLNPTHFSRRRRVVLTRLICGGRPIYQVNPAPPWTPAADQSS